MHTDIHCCICLSINAMISLLPHYSLIRPPLLHLPKKVRKEGVRYYVLNFLCTCRGPWNAQVGLVNTRSGNKHVQIAFILTRYCGIRTRRCIEQSQVGVGMARLSRCDMYINMHPSPLRNKIVKEDRPFDEMPQRRMPSLLHASTGHHTNTSCLHLAALSQRQPIAQTTADHRACLACHRPICIWSPLTRSSMRSV